MLNLLYTLFYFILALAILIAVHEYGHFLMARLCGVYVERFSLGFGKVLFSVHDRKGTEYSLSLIPLGGYVKMYGEGATPTGAEDPRQHESFYYKKPWQKFLIVAAGPLSNIVLAWFLYSCTFMVGIEQMRPVFEVVPNSPIAMAGLHNQDLIKAVNGKEVDDFESVAYELIARIGDDEPVVLEVAGGLGKDAKRTISVSLKDWVLDPEQRDIFGDIGLRPYYGDVKNEIAFVQSDSPAQQAGIQEQDAIVSYAGKPYSSWFAFTDYIKQHPNEPIPVEVKRNNATIKLTLTPVKKSSLRKHQDSKQAQKGDEEGFAGLAPVMSRNSDLYYTKQYSFLNSFVQGANKTVDMTVITLKFIGKFITGDISYKNVSGPIGIAEGASLTAKIGFIVYISFLAMISVNLGILNLLPVPVLDGAHLVFYTLEAIRGKPLPEAVMNGLLRVGMFLLLLLMCVAIFNDIYYRL